MNSFDCRKAASSRFTRQLGHWLGPGLAMLMLAALPIHTAQAQMVAPPIPSPTIDRDRLDRAEPVVPHRAAPAPSIPASVEVKGVAAPAVILTRVHFEGSTLAPKVLQEAVAPWLGAKLDKDALQQIANAVSATYAHSDIAFYAVSIPPQLSTGGVLIVRAVEGRIADYALAGKTSSTPVHLIDHQVKRLMRETPTRKSSLERTMSLLRDIPGQTVEAKLRQTGTPGQVALDLEVKRKQVEISLNLNNGGVVNVVSGVQAQLGVAVNGLLREGDVTRFSGSLPFQPDRYQFYTLSHATPLGSNGTTIGVSGAYVRTLTQDDIRGDARQLGLAISHPLIRSYHRNLSVQASLDGTNSDNYYLDTAFGQFRARTLRIGASWSSVGAKDGYAVSLSLSQGLNALGARPLEGYSDTSYRKANGQITGVKQIGKTVSFRATVRGQFTRDLLPTTERFSLGGEGAGVAYRTGIVTADKAVAGDMELAWQAVGDAKSTRGLTVFAYADGALAHSYARPFYALPATDYSLATAGGGVRVKPVKGLITTAQIAVPVKKIAPDYSNKARFLFSITRTI